MQTDFALIGKTLGHSFSARFFNEKFRREGISSSYTLEEFQNFSLVIPWIKRHPRVLGLNVTIPYKEDAFRACDVLTDSAKAIGAVNTIRIERVAGSSDNIRLFGHNTDAPGFMKAVAPYLEKFGDVRGASALVLGTGGAAKAVSYALHQLGFKPVNVSRNAGEQLAPGYGRLTYADLTPEVMAENLVIVNATPLGMSPKTDSCPDIPYECLTSRHLLFDCIYNPEETLFMRKAREHGAVAVNGLEMLHNQALLAYDFWLQRDTEV